MTPAEFCASRTGSRILGLVPWYGWVFLFATLAVIAVSGWWASEGSFWCLVPWIPWAVAYRSLVWWDRRRG